MELYNVLSSFGGGVFGAAIGGTPAFVLTGFLAITGGVLSLAGVSDATLGTIAFGNFLGPKVAFVGAVAAAGYAYKKNALSCGANINISLHGTGKPDVLFVGGIFGTLGYLVEYLYNNILHLNTDTTALTVVTLGIVVRLLFGKTGILGKCEGKRAWFLTKQELCHALIMGAGIGLCVGGIGISIMNSGVSKKFLCFYPNIVFGISAISLLMILMGLNGMATHHITLPTALAIVASGNLGIAFLVGIISSIFCEYVARTINTYVDSHIDPPAVVIATMTLLINILLV